MDLYDIVIKLTGPVHPIGDSGEDEKRLVNLKELTELTDKLLCEISNIARNITRQEASMKAIGAHARDFMIDVKTIYGYI